MVDTIPVCPECDREDSVQLLDIIKDPETPGEPDYRYICHACGYDWHVKMCEED